MPNAPHLIERAAARLAAAGAIPGQLSPISAGAGRSVGLEPLDAPPYQPPSPSSPSRPAIARGLLEKAGLMTDQAGRSRISEELWLVQRQVLRTAFAPAGATLAAEPAGAFPNLLLVTSARPGEGKSFTALNLAASIARQGDHPVLLIDTDVKEHSLTRLLGLSEEPGLLDCAADDTLDAPRLDHPTEVNGLSVLPIGRGQHTKGSDLLASRHVGRLLNGIARRQTDRLVILDGAPCLATSDPAALAPLMGQIIFVVEAERTQRPHVEAALDLIGECPSITLVLNKMQQGGGNAFGAYAPYYTS
jgi:protein-tyrosine kinase